MTRSEAAKAFFIKSARGGHAVILHFQIRLHEGQRAGLCMALGTLRSAFRPPSDVPLDRTGRRLLRRPGTVCAQLHSGWRDWRFRFGLGVDRGGVVCAVDGAAVDCWIE